MQLTDKDITPEFVDQVQPVLTAKLPGVRCDYRQLQTNPINYPVEIRVVSQADVSTAQSAQDIAELRRIASQVEDIVRSADEARRVRNEWQKESFQVTLNIDPDRANLAGITNLDVANSATSAMSGTTVTTLQDGDKNIPVVARLQMNERARLSDIQNLYVYSSSSNDNDQDPAGADLRHPEQHDDQPHYPHRPLPRDVDLRLSGAGPPGIGDHHCRSAQAAGVREDHAAGLRITVGGEYNKQQDGFRNLTMVLAISVLAIYLALLFQFNNAIKPLLVFAAAPYGVAGAIFGLWVMNTSFGFMAFLGIASLIGVIVSHVIVLFDFIEEMHAKGEPFEEAVIDAGIIRLRPVMITVGATVLALFPLAMHGGPLWQPLCYAQIGGLTVATFITLLMVPVLYSIFVLDLKILTWDAKEKAAAEEKRNAASAPATAPAQS